MKTTLTSATSGAHFGATLAESNDGTTAAIGSSKTPVPRVDVYAIGTSTLTATGAVTDPSGKTTSGYAANGLSLNASGAVLAVGAPGVNTITGSSNTYSGVAYAYATSNTSSYQTLTTIGSATDKFGTAVSVSPNGLKVAAGMPGVSNYGTTMLFTRATITSTFGTPTSIYTALGSPSVAGSGEAFGTNSRLVVGNPSLAYSGRPANSGEAEIVDLS